MILRAVNRADIENTDGLRNDGAKNGWIMETAEEGPYLESSVAHTLQNFQDAVLDKERVDASGINNNNPALRYTSVHGYPMQMTYHPHGTAYTNQNKVNNEVLSYNSWPLLENSWISQVVNGDTLTINHGNKTMVYDFKNWTTQH